MKYKKMILCNARALRKNMTKEERHLWYDFLKPYPIKIYKQRILGNYIADFYCAKANLVIELDGSQHYIGDGPLRDKMRDEFFKTMGIEVLRFTNADINRNFDGVCIAIDSRIKKLYQE